MSLQIPMPSNGQIQTFEPFLGFACVSFPRSISPTLGFMTRVGSRIFEVSYKNIYWYFSSLPLFFSLHHLQPSTTHDFRRSHNVPASHRLRLRSYPCFQDLIRQPFFLTPTFFLGILVPRLSFFIVLLPFSFFLFLLLVGVSIFMFSYVLGPQFWLSFSNSFFFLSQCNPACVVFLSFCVIVVVKMVSGDSVDHMVDGADDFFEVR